MGRFVIAAVSPAVVVPSLLSLSERGYGLDKGVPTLVIAAASVDDVLAITGFGVLLGITFSSGQFTGGLLGIVTVVFIDDKILTNLVKILYYCNIYGYSFQCCFTFTETIRLIRDMGMITNPFKYL